MIRAVLGRLFLVAAVFLSACGGDEGGLYGSECELIDCHYDRIECQLYSPPNHEIVVHYLLNPDTAREWVARISISLEGVEQVEGTRFEDQEFLGRVQLDRPESPQQWPEFTGRFCEIRSGGDQAGKDMSGKCAFSFINGYLMTAEFSCRLEAVD